jgi:hypothetical protein
VGRHPRVLLALALGAPAAATHFGSSFRRGLRHDRDRRHLEHQGLRRTALRRPRSGHGHERPRTDDRPANARSRRRSHRSEHCTRHEDASAYSSRPRWHHTNSCRPAPAPARSARDESSDRASHHPTAAPPTWLPQPHKRSPHPLRRICGSASQQCWLSTDPVAARCLLLLSDDLRGGPHGRAWPGDWRKLCSRPHPRPDRSPSASDPLSGGVRAGERRSASEVG